MDIIERDLSRYPANPLAGALHFLGMAAFCVDAGPHMALTSPESRLHQKSRSSSASGNVARRVLLMAFGAASAAGMVANGVPSDLLAQEGKEKTVEKKAETPEQKFAVYAQKFTKQDPLLQKYEEDVLTHGVPGVRQFLDAFLRPSPLHSRAFALHCRNIVVREARAGGKGNPEVIAMLVDRLSSPGAPELSSLEETIVLVGTPAVDQLYAAFDGSRWKASTADELPRLKAVSSAAADVVHAMLGEDAKQIPDDALLPRLHGTLTASSDKEFTPDDDVRANAAKSLMRRPAGMPWVQKALPDERAARNVLAGLLREMNGAPQGEFLPLSDAGTDIAKRYREVLLAVSITMRSSLTRDVEQILQRLSDEEASREKRLKEFRGKN